MAERVEEEDLEPETAHEQTSSAAIALALGRAGHGRGAKALDAKAEAFLDQQTRLARLQADHLLEQHMLHLAHLRVRRWKDRLSLVLQGLGLAAGAAVVAIVAVMAWTAHQDHGLAIEAFSAPPGLAQRGLSGEAVAGEVMDKLGAIKLVADQNSLSRTNKVKADRDADIKVEIPETGLSVTAAWRLLRDLIGGERKVEGELRQADDGSLMMTTRIEGVPAITVSGAPQDLDKIEQQVAERIFEAFDPGNYVIYLDATGRTLDALNTAERLARASPDYFSLWSTVEHAVDPERALALAVMAETADPVSPYPPFERLRAERDLGHAEEALAAALRLGQRMREPQTAPLSGSGGAELRGLAQTTIDTLHGDVFNDALQADRQAAGGSSTLRQVVDAAALHEPSRARNLLATLSAVGALDGPGLARARWAVDAAADDWRAAADDAAALMALDDAARAKDPVPAGVAGLARVAAANDAPRLAEAKARTGDLVGAAAVIASTPSDAYDAVRARGRIAAAGRDWAAADRWFALARHLAPSPPFAELDWASALQARGDVDGAIAKLAAAHAKGPAFADPLELWGEALMLKGDFAGAAARFALADRTAPRWGRNHLEWGVALMRAGRYAPARKEFVAADRLDLSRPDRAALNVLLARTSSGPLHG